MGENRGTPLTEKFMCIQVENDCMDLEDIEDRTNRIKFTPELIDTYGIERSVIENKAKTLEDSVNGVVFVTEGEFRGEIKVDVISARSAEEVIIQRLLKDMHSEVIRSSDDGNELW